MAIKSLFEAEASQEILDRIEKLAEKAPAKKAAAKAVGPVAQLQNEIAKLTAQLKAARTKQAAEATKEAIKNYTNKAFSILESLNISEDKKQLLRAFGNSLMNRTV